MLVAGRPSAFDVREAADSKRLSIGSDTGLPKFELEDGVTGNYLWAISASKDGAAVIDQEECTVADYRFSVIRGRLVESPVFAPHHSANPSHDSSCCLSGIPASVRKLARVGGLERAIQAVAEIYQDRL